MEGLPAKLPEQANIEDHPRRKRAYSPSPPTRTGSPGESIHQPQRRFEALPSVRIPGGTTHHQRHEVFSLYRFALSRAIRCGLHRARVSRRQAQARRPAACHRACYRRSSDDFWFLERDATMHRRIDRFTAAHDITKPLDTLSGEEVNEVIKSPRRSLRNESTPACNRMSHLSE